MSLAITDEHRALADVARSFLHDHDVRRAARDQLDAAEESLPSFWPALSSLGWLGLAVPEKYGGEGYGIPELAIVLEELGRVVAPGPFLPTVLASAIITASGDPDAADVLPSLVSGTTLGAVGFGGSLSYDGSTLNGDAGPVLGGCAAHILLLPVGPDIAVVPAAAGGLTRVPSVGIDPTRRLANITCDGVSDVRILPGARAGAGRLARTLAAAEAVGSAQACVEMSVAYAQEREQFGRTIGTFQAVKHHAADMLVAAELATAATWGAARSDQASPEADLTTAVAAAVSVRAAVDNAQQNIQLHGGIGFTWEHDAQLYLRRASALAGLLDALGDADLDVARFTGQGITQHPMIDLPPEAEQFRGQARAKAREISALAPERQRAELVASGYLVPHWPRPWGRSASAAEQLVIEEEFADVHVPSMGITGWNILTIIRHGTQDQRDRWVQDALVGRTKWCQLFSEPAAGSDAAAIRTKGIRTEGGWLVSGQKVWTTGAHECQWGFATVRTDSTGSKHQGVTMMAVDLRSGGVDVRPLRELTGDAMFNEVFFDDAFVPDENVVGEVGHGWTVARATLGNERVSIGEDRSPIAIEGRALVRLVDKYRCGDTGYLRAAGELVGVEQSLHLLNLRQASRAVEGAGPGPEGNVTKLVTAEHIQHVTELVMRVCGPDAVSGARRRATHAYLFGRCYTIAGGTAEIVRSQIAERILGLPRDPLIT